MEDSVVVKVKSDEASNDGAEVWTMSTGNQSPSKDLRQRTTMDADDDPAVPHPVATAAASRSAGVESIDLEEDSAVRNGARRKGQALIKYPKFTRLNLTAMPVRPVTTRWDKFDESDEINATAAAVTNGKELPEHPMTCWWITVSSMLTVLFYSVCIGTMPLIFFVLMYYLTWESKYYEAKLTGTNSTNPVVAILP